MRSPACSAVVELVTLGLLSPFCHGDAVPAELAHVEDLLP